MNAPHRHDRPEFPPVDAAVYGGTAGQSVDMTAAADLIGAAMAGCRPCQRSGMYEVSRGQAIPAAHLIATGFNVLSQAYAPVAGPIPDQVLNTRYHQATARVWRAMRDAGPAAAGRIVTEMNRDDRRAALDDALDTIAGMPDAVRVIDQMFRTQQTAGNPVSDLSLSELQSLGRTLVDGADFAGVRVVDVSDLVDEATGPEPVGGLTIGWYGQYPALVADEQPSTIAIGGTGAADLVKQSWIRAGFVEAAPDTQPPALPQGWAVQLHGQTLVSVTAPGDHMWWQADDAGLAVQLPTEWTDAVRRMQTVALVAGDIGLDLVDGDGYAEAVRHAIRVGRVVHGLAALVDQPA